MNRRETNPHFSRPRPQHQDHQQPPIPTVPHQEHDGQPPTSLPPGASSREKRGRTPREGVRKQHEDQPYLVPRAYGGQPLPRQKRDRTPHGHACTQHEDQPQPLPQEHLGQPPYEGSRKQHEDQPYLPPRAYSGQPPSREKRDRTPLGGACTQHKDQPPPQENLGQPPHEGSHKQHEDQAYLIPRARGGWTPCKAHPQHEDQPHQPPQDYRGQPPKVNFQEQSPKPHGSLMLPPLERHHEHSTKPYHSRHPLDIGVDSSQKSKACTWCGIVFYLIFWLVLIVVGLIVLIMYLVFRPQSPHFDVSSVTLNAAYLDLGYLLNADITLLANFTNPNKRVHVDFSSVIIYLYYRSALISMQYVEPFSAARNQSRFAAIHMVTSQVQLPLKESQRMAKQMESNGVLLEVSGVFRAQSKLGKILRYSYNLYGHCNIC
ncbi:unnamed protein product [Lupinus luteus]|uniref:Late embryogenesis abundant protein LEA-2 subgroup domain-containing protein n=1 Tax=Lupinus luteus TaxID=3873 RepID=A0AAV1WB06_LUPLU